MSDFKLPDYLTGNLTEVVVGDYVSSAGLSFKVTGFPSDELIEIVPSVDVGVGPTTVPRTLLTDNDATHAGFIGDVVVLYGGMYTIVGYEPDHRLIQLQDSDSDEVLSEEDVLLNGFLGLMFE
mgnify:CR=1 FL=1